MEQDPHDIAAGLPPLRDDEPPSLRQDIVDELNDHLQCAIRREQLTGSVDPQAVIQRLFVRFGDPRKIARTLYWQAMRSRVMQQRIVVASAVGMLAACVTMVTLMWVMLERQQLQADRQQANFEAMLDRMNTPPRMFGSLSVHLNRPLRGSLLLSGSNLKEHVQGVLGDSSASDGSRVYDFGELSPGIYELSIDNDGWFIRKKFVIRSGDSRREEFLIPEATEPVLITFTSNLPSYFGIPIDFHPRKKMIEGREWTRSYLSGFYLKSTASRASADHAGRVPMKLTYDLDAPEGSQKLNAVIGPLDDDSGKVTENRLVHIVELDLKPGKNECHVEVPAEWIRRLTEHIPVPAPAAAAIAPKPVQ